MVRIFQLSKTYSNGDGSNFDRKSSLKSVLNIWRMQLKVVHYEKDIPSNLTENKRGHERALVVFSIDGATRRFIII